MFEEFGCDQAVNSFDVALVEGDEDSAFIGEVLVNGADADAGDFGNAVGGDCGEAFAFKDADDGVEYGFDGVAGTGLLGLTAARKLHYAEYTSRM